MRWDALFADLEAQMHAAGSAAASDDEVAGMVRAEVARTALGDRLRAHVGARVVLRLVDGQWLRGVVLEAAPQWLLLAEGEASGPVSGGLSGGMSGRMPGAQSRVALVPLAALERVTGLTRSVAPPAGALERRLGLGTALRALSRDRVGVVLVLRGGDLTGTIDRVGADHVDLAVHPDGEARRRELVSEVVAVPVAAVLAVRSVAAQPAP